MTARRVGSSGCGRTEPNQRGMIALSVDEVAELRARDAGDAAMNHYLREPDKLGGVP